MMYRRVQVPTLLAVALWVLGPVSPAAASAAVPLEQMAPARPLAPRAATPSQAPPLRLAERAGVTPFAVLSDAATGAGDQLAALEAWNRAGRRPLQTGFVRPVPLARTVRFDTDLPEGAGSHDGGLLVRSGPAGMVWGAQVTVEEAHRLKLHLDDVELPAGARLWVYGERGPAKGPFGSDLLVEGGLWTPAVRGPVLRLEVELPAPPAPGSGVSFTIDSVAEIVRLDADGAPLLGRPSPKVDSSCLVNAECVSDLDVPPIEEMQDATALIFFIRGDRVGLCSGGLLNSQSQLPFLLTANHCIDSRASAASTDLFWDYKQECNGPVNEDFLETFGAELLATGTSSDYTLLLLDALPPGRFLLGWDARPEAAAPGTVLHRVSHPVGDGGLFPQGYSSHRILADPLLCSPRFDDPPIDDLTHFGYSESLEGGTLSGSSGAPLVNDAGQAVGQLLGGCGPDPAEGCDQRNQDVDGLFRETFQFIFSYLLDPEGDGFVPPPGDTWLSTPALPGFDAQVRITGGSTIAGDLEADCIPETLCVSGALTGRSEVFVKVIGPRPNGYLWAQISRFTPAKVEIWLRQTATDEINYYILDAIRGDTAEVTGLQDREAFVP